MQIYKLEPGLPKKFIRSVLLIMKAKLFVRKKKTRKRIPIGINY